MEDLEYNESLLAQTNVTSTKKNDSLSDNISLFQAIHVLQSKDEDEDDNEENEDGTKAGIIFVNELQTLFQLVYILLIHSQIWNIFNEYFISISRVSQ